MRRAVLLLLAAASMPALPAHAATETHQPPWDGKLCTPVEVSVAHFDIVRTGGCTLDNPLAMAGVASSNRSGPGCPPQSGACANAMPYWGSPTDTYTTSGAGSGRIDVLGTPGVCIDVGTRGGDASYGTGCGSSVTFRVTRARQIVVTMRGPGIVSQLTYTFPI